ncbi:hypothetical protein [Actinophytocola sp.]|uniref:hypothetical protein n=1 Tax=Actinophytocola sp. TaxID=1872138 RepID=UPI003D6B7C34
MYGRLFTLTTIDDDSKVFAWGIEIVGDEDKPEDSEAVIYRKDPETGRTLFGVHDSAQAACDRWSGIVPLEISWEESYVPISAIASATPASSALSNGMGSWPADSGSDSLPCPVMSPAVTG